MLNYLREPYRLGVDPAIGHILIATSNDVAPAAAGQLAAQRLIDAVERLRRPDDADRHERLPYLVLKTCFVDGVKMLAAADRLVLSRRQLTRECGRAVERLHGELVSHVQRPAAARGYAGEPLPTIAQFMPRPHVTNELGARLGRASLVHVHGPKGVGKTSLVADYAANAARTRPVIWYRFRPGMNTSWSSLSFDVADYLKSRGHGEAAEYLGRTLGSADPALVARILIRDLRDEDSLFVFDDFHLAEDDPHIGGFLDEASSRLPTLSIIAIGRHRPDGPVENTYEVPPLNASETHALLGQLDVRVKPDMAELIRDWTQGVTHLVRLAASWIRTVTAAEVTKGLAAFTQLDEVQGFLLDSVTDLLDSRDRSILQAASVFRDRFTDESLAYVAERTVGEVRDTSRRLVRYHVASRGRLGDVAFFHASVREYIYAHLDDDTRHRMHARAAAWFELTGPESEAAWQRGRLPQAEPEAKIRARSSRQLATRPS
jgi:ATP/maltotriose-dependent transcriptional regulator MalT